MLQAMTSLSAIFISYSSFIIYKILIGIYAFLKLLCILSQCCILCHFQVNYAALERYKWIINLVRSHGMKVMLTLFHHSLPPWASEYGGWKLEKTVDHFMHFTRL